MRHGHPRDRAPAGPVPRRAARQRHGAGVRRRLHLPRICRTVRPRAPTRCRRVAYRGSRSIRTLSSSVPIRRTTSALSRSPIRRRRARGSSSSRRCAGPSRRRAQLIRTRGFERMLRSRPLERRARRRSRRSRRRRRGRPVSGAAGRCAGRSSRGWRSCPGTTPCRADHRTSGLTARVATVVLIRCLSTLYLPAERSSAADLLGQPPGGARRVAPADS